MISSDEDLGFPKPCSVVVKMGDKVIEGITTIEYKETPRMNILMQTEYYMHRLNNYYFRNKFGNGVITSEDKEFVGSLVYGKKYDITFTGLEIVK